MWLWPWPHHSICQFGSTVNSKARWRRNNRIRKENIFYAIKLSGFKSFRIQSSHFRHFLNSGFKISGDIDQTGEFLLRIRSLVCERQNQSFPSLVNRFLDKNPALLLVPLLFSPFPTLPTTQWNSFKRASKSSTKWLTLKGLDYTTQIGTLPEPCINNLWF